MLCVRNLSFAFEDKKIINDVSFDIDVGDFVGFIGKNGAGKTTVFRCILSLNGKYDGQITIDGHNIKSLNIKELSKIIAYIPQKNHYVFSYNVITTLLMGTVNQMGFFEKPTEKQYEQCRDIMRMLGITQLSHRSFNHISGGEQQLVLIARALMQNTKYIVMDEPTSALDFANQEKVMNLIRELCKERNIGVIVSSHNPNLILKYCSRIIALHSGKVIADGETRTKLNEELIKNMFDIDTKIYNSEYGPYVQSKL